MTRGTVAKRQRRLGQRKQPRHKRFNEVAFRAVLRSKTKAQLVQLNRDNGFKVTSRDNVGTLTDRLVNHFKNVNA